MEKKKRHYSLDLIKKMVVRGDWRMTSMSVSHAWKDFGIIQKGVQKVILELEMRDFYKSMTSYHQSTYWQDVYRPMVGSTMAYIKLSIVDNETVVVQFKRK